MSETKIDLEALGVVDQDGAASDAFARILLVGPAKAGKTTCIARTAPKPLIINCDGLGATKGAANQGAKFLTIDASTRSSLKKAVSVTRKLVAAGEVRTVILDTITLLADNLIDEIGLTLEGFEKWGELGSTLTRTVKDLFKLEAHVFLTAHITPDFEGASGVLPMIAGSSKIRIPSLVADWVMLDVEADRKPHERLFLLGPQKYWNHSGRNVKRTCAIEADVGKLFEELGIEP